MISVIQVTRQPIFITTIKLIFIPYFSYSYDEFIFLKSTLVVADNYFYNGCSTNQQRYNGT